MLVHYLSDSLQSAAGYLMFADKRMEPVSYTHLDVYKRQVSDVVVLHQNGQDTAHYCDSVGFQQVPERCV